MAVKEREAQPVIGGLRVRRHEQSFDQNVNVNIPAPCMERNRSKENATDSQNVTGIVIDSRMEGNSCEEQGTQFKHLAGDKSDDTVQSPTTVRTKQKSTTVQSELNQNANYNIVHAMHVMAEVGFKEAPIQHGQPSVNPNNTKVQQPTDTGGDSHCTVTEKAKKDMEEDVNKVKVETLEWKAVV